MQDAPYLLIGHKDHGKSTLIGRLILDSKSVRAQKTGSKNKGFLRARNAMAWALFREDMWFMVYGVNCCFAFLS